MRLAAVGSSRSALEGVVDENNVDRRADRYGLRLPAIDDDAGRAVIAKGLQAADVALIDVGMGLYLAECGIGGQVRTSSLPSRRDHLWDDRKRFPASVRAPTISTATGKSSR